MYKIMCRKKEKLCKELFAWWLPFAWNFKLRKIDGSLCVFSSTSWALLARKELCLLSRNEEQERESSGCSSIHSDPFLTISFHAPSRQSFVYQFVVDTCGSTRRCIAWAWFLSDGSRQIQISLLQRKKLDEFFGFVSGCDVYFSRCMQTTEPTETRVVNRKGAAVSEFLSGTLARKNEERQCWSSTRRFGARHAIILVKPEPLLTAALRRDTFVVKFNFKQHTEMPMPFRCTCTVSVDLHTKSPHPAVPSIATIRWFSRHRSAVYFRVVSRFLWPS